MTRFLTKSARLVINLDTLSKSKVAESVMLGFKVDNASNTLSGGMKRKIHLGIALMADPKGGHTV